MSKYFILLFLFLVLPAAFAQTHNMVVSSEDLRPAPVIGGDAGPSPAVPTGSINNSNSSIFPVSQQQLPLIINLRTETYSHNTHQYMGKRVVLTLRTNTLNPMQADLIAGILQSNLNVLPSNGWQNTSIDVGEDQLVQIQNVLVASHGKQITQQTWLFHYLPIVRKFCYWAVLLGVIFATIMLAVGAYGMVMSHRGSADKIISTAAGLMVLLMAYTIYNLLIANASNRQAFNQTTYSQQ